MQNESKKEVIAVVFTNLKGKSGKYTHEPSEKMLTDTNLVLSDQSKCRSHEPLWFSELLLRLPHSVDASRPTWLFLVITMASEQGK